MITDFYIRPDYRYAAWAKRYFRLPASEQRERCLLHRNRRNTIYSLQIPFDDCQLIVKQTTPAARYSRLRRFEFYVRNILRNYGKRAYHGALMLRETGIDTLLPVGHWKDGESRFLRNSCFLYEMIPTDFSLLDAFAGHTSIQFKLTELRAKMVEISRLLHDNGLLHGDLAANNFLVKLDQRNPGSLNSATVYLIDTDHVRANRAPGKFLKRFFSLKCFARIHFVGLEREQFLQEYLGRDYHPAWLRVLNFWSWHDRGPVRQLKAKLNYLFSASINSFNFSRS